MGLIDGLLLLLLVKRQAHPEGQWEGKERTPLWTCLCLWCEVVRLLGKASLTYCGREASSFFSKERSLAFVWYVSLRSHEGRNARPITALLMRSLLAERNEWESIMTKHFLWRFRRS